MLTLLAESNLPLLALGCSAEKSEWVGEVVLSLLTTDQGFISPNVVA